jgi:pullulanase/glycogen debranching enzyme
MRWTLLAAGTLAMASLARGALALECEGPHETLLREAPALPAAFADARAAWLDANHLRWAGRPGDARYRLLQSRSGQLQLTAGEPVRGVDAALLLEPAAPQPVTPSTQRFSHIADGATLAVRARDRARLRELHRGQLMLVREDAQGRVLDATAVQAAGALDALYARAQAVPDLGAAPHAGATRFKLWAPTAQRVALCLLDGRGNTSQHAMSRDAASGVWAAALPRSLAGARYRYAVDVFVRGRGLVRNRVTDPYSLSLTTDSQRSVVLDLAAPALVPPGWRATPHPQRVAAPTDLVIYELHVRDFSIGDASVPAAHRGKYLAFTDAGSDGMRHLRALAQAGVTDVHLLPVFDFATVPERGCTTPAVPAAAPDSDAQQAAVMREVAGDCFNWGYDPWHFTAPEGSYASDAEDGAARVREFRAMVQALHRAGLRVGMDMVYNHTSASGQHPHSVLDRIVPGYYQRLDATGAVERSTCCDNTATEHAMMAKLMIDSAVVWARDHGIDSFRFDLMGHQPSEAMQRLQHAASAAAGGRIDVIGEGWNFGEVKDGQRFVQAAQRSLNGSGIGTFNDRIRDAARGRDDSRGWLHGSGDAKQADLLRAGLAGTLIGGPRADYNGQDAGYASQPAEVVNYVENHDNPTLFDQGVMKLPADTSRADRVRVQTLGAAIVALSQGIAYFHAGQDILRSKSLDRNSYDSGDWFNRLDWSLQDNGFGAGLERGNKDHWPAMKPLLAAAAAIKPTAADIAQARDDFLDLLRIRAGTTLLRLRSADEIARRLVFFNTGPSQKPNLIAGHLDGEGLEGARFRELLYLLNADAQPQTLAMEAMKGKPFVLHPVQRARGTTGAAFEPDSGTLSVPARSAVVFVVE